MELKGEEINSLLNAVHSTVPNTLPKSSENKPPVGYIRAKVHGRGVLMSALLDSGNLFADLISEKLARTLSLKISGTARTVGTASAKGSVTVLGRVRPFRVYLEGMPNPFYIHPYVVQDLAHCVNLGQAFLRRNSIDLRFRETGVEVSHRGHSASLTSSSASLSRKSIDARITKVLEKLKQDGGNPSFHPGNILDLRVAALPADCSVPGVNYGVRKKTLTWSPTKYRVYTQAKVKLAPGKVTPVIVTRTKNYSKPQYLGAVVNSVQLTPTQNSKVCNKNDLFVHPGVYCRQDDQTTILVSNLGSDECELPANVLVGWINESNGEENPDINTLDHKEPELLSAAELKERRDFIEESLKLNENKILKEKPAAKEEVIQMFLRNWGAVSVNDSDYGRTNLGKFSIELLPNSQPVRAKTRPLNPFQEADLRRQIDNWTKAGVIEKSMSPWASALVPVKKKGSDKLRWAVDYRAVNKLTVKDAYPLASIETNLHKLAGSKFFSTVDSSGAFHTLEIEPDSREYTTFVSPLGSYQFIRLPFGLCNAPSRYSRIVQMALDKIGSEFCLGFIDDVIVHSATFEEHLQHLEQVLEAHVQAGMKLNMGKCFIIQDQVDYLGHRVSEKGIEMIPSYVDRVLQWPLPQTGKDLRSFLGFSGYYRSFIKDYSRLTSQMNQLKTAKEVEWTEQAKRDFEELKQCFSTAPVRGFPMYYSSEPFLLDTDWSAVNMAAILSQKQAGKERFLGCVAKKCNIAESNYSSTKGELAAVVLGLRKFEHILRAKPFVLRTDSKSVENLRTMKEARGIYARWQNLIGSFQFSITHRAGTAQKNADALSRCPNLPEDPATDKLLEIKDDLGDIDDIYTMEQKEETLSLEDLRNKTALDPVLTEIMPFVRDGRKPDKQERKRLGRDGNAYVNLFETLKEENGILYMYPPEVNGEKKPRKMCIPESLQEKAFRICHAHPISGHLGINKTSGLLAERFYWPNLYTFAKARILNCVPCLCKRQTFETGRHKMYREPLSYINQRVYADAVGPYSPGVKFRGETVRYWISIEDGFSRYLVTGPIKDLSAKTVAEAIVDLWINVFSVPEKIHTDRGACFTAAVFQEVMKLLGITHTVTPPYSPEGDRVERTHSVIQSCMRSDDRFPEKDWPRKLAAATAAWNFATHRITKCSPFYAMFGRNPRLPVDVVFPLSEEEPQKLSQYVQDLKERFNHIHRRMVQQEKAAIDLETGKKHGRQNPEFAEGDIVYMFLATIKLNLSRKLQNRWIGPWKIKKKISDSLVILFPLGNWAKNKRELACIVSRLKKVDPKLAIASKIRNKKVIDLAEILKDLTPASEHLAFEAESVENDLIRPENPKEKENEPETIPPLSSSFSPPEVDDRNLEYDSDSGSEESVFSESTRPVGDASVSQEDDSERGEGSSRNGAPGNMEENHSNGSVTNGNLMPTSEPQIASPSPPSQPQLARRIAPRTPSRFFIPQPPRNAEFAPTKERSDAVRRAVRKLGTQLEGFKINTDLERHQRAAKKRVKKGQYEE